jgi:hypothetical protein
MLSRGAAMANADRESSDLAVLREHVQRAFGVDQSMFETLRNATGTPPVEFESDVAAFNPLLLLDPLDQLGFIDEHSLERLLERAIEDSAWRADRTASLRNYALQHCTHEAFARDLLRRTADIYSGMDAE